MTWCPACLRWSLSLEAILATEPTVTRHNLHRLGECPALFIRPYPIISRLPGVGHGTIRAVGSIAGQVVRAFAQSTARSVILPCRLVSVGGNGNPRRGSRQSSRRSRNTPSCPARLHWSLSLEAILATEPTMTMHDLQRLDKYPVLLGGAFTGNLDGNFRVDHKQYLLDCDDSWPLSFAPTLSSVIGYQALGTARQ